MQHPGFSRDDSKRPDCTTQIPWSRVKSILWEETVGESLATSCINESSIHVLL